MYDDKQQVIYQINKTATMFYLHPTEVQKAYWKAKDFNLADVFQQIKRPLLHSTEYLRYKKSRFSRYKLNQHSGIIFMHWD